MKAIYNRELYHILKDDGNGVYLMVPRDYEELFVKYSDTNLIIDPTDDEVKHAEDINNWAYGSGPGTLAGNDDL